MSKGKKNVGGRSKRAKNDRKSIIWMVPIGVSSLNIGSVHRIIGCYVECSVVSF